MIRTLAILLIGVLLTACEKPPEAKATVQAGEIVKKAGFILKDFGIYDAVVLTEGSWKLGVPERVVSVTGLKHREETVKIPAQDGIYWGFRGELINLPQEPVTVKIEIVHPEYTRPDGSASTGDVQEGVVKPGDELPGEFLWYFTDTSRFEQVPGTWTTKIYVDGTEIFSKIFVVYGVHGRR